LSVRSCVMSKLLHGRGARGKSKIIYGHVLIVDQRWDAGIDLSCGDEKMEKLAWGRSVRACNLIVGGIVASEKAFRK
jgi:hypothetical protein